MLQANIYNLEFSKEVIEKNIKRLTNQIWKLIPMFENGEDWKKQLNTIINEIVGLSKIFLNNPQFLQLLAKLEGLNESNSIEFSFYRKTVFEAISLLQGLLKWT